MSNFLGSEEKKGCLRVVAPAKVNLHLEVLGIRSDDFHELAMVMQSIDLADYLEISPSEDRFINLTSDDQSLSTGSDNLIIRAANLLRERSGCRNLGASIYLQKNIPIGAGLAGGSSDAAATLLGLNKLWGTGLSKDELKDIASEIGSDVPFCLEGGTQLCFGRGECLEPSMALGTSMGLLLVKDPKVTVSTPWAYGLSRERNSSRYLTSEAEFEMRRQLLRSKSWLKNWSVKDPPPLYNDLELVVAPVVPAVRKALRLLSNLPGAISFAMSGSGPSCFALYPGKSLAQRDLDRHREAFEKEGLDTWCCSFRTEGVELGNE